MNETKMDPPSLNLTFEKEINGKNKEFWIQLIPDEEKEKVLDLFCKDYVRDEVLCKCSRIIENEASMQHFGEFFRIAINQNQSLACFTKLDNNENDIVAVNICYKNSACKKIMEQMKDIPDPLRKITDVLIHIEELKEVTKEIGVEDYLTSAGLLVTSEYRGFNIGLQLLAARKVLCNSIGLKASVTAFTSPASQRLAEKAGFKDIQMITYDDLEKMRPDLKFPNINQYSKCIRNMYILYD